MDCSDIIEKYDIIYVTEDYDFIIGDNYLQRLWSELKQGVKYLKLYKEKI